MSGDQRPAGVHSGIVVRPATRADVGAITEIYNQAGYDATVEHSVYVRTDRRAGGVGTALLLPLIDRARAEGRHVMLGGVDADNAGSIAFHERHGFAVVARFHQVGRKFDRWLDLVFVQLLLSDDPADSSDGRPAL